MGTGNSLSFFLQCTLNLHFRPEDKRKIFTPSEKVVLQIVHRDFPGLIEHFVRRYLNFIPTTGSYILLFASFAICYTLLASHLLSDDTVKIDKFL